MPLSESQRYIFFFGMDAVYSQFFPNKFVEDGQTFTCMEQYMHFKKAETFGDKESCRSILATTSPFNHKRLGRRVRFYRDPIWTAKSKLVVKRGNLLKFKQNNNLKKILIASHPKYLVEASPYDKKWGIGRALGDPCIHDSKNWRGENLLGRILMEVREELMQD